MIHLVISRKKEKFLNFGVVIVENRFVSLPFRPHLFICYGIHWLEQCRVNELMEILLTRPFHFWMFMCVCIYSLNFFFFSYFTIKKSKKNKKKKKKTASNMILLKHFFSSYSLAMLNNCVILKFCCKTLRGSIHPKKTDTQTHSHILTFLFTYHILFYTVHWIYDFSVWKIKIKKQRSFQNCMELSFMNLDAIILL